MVVAAVVSSGVLPAGEPVPGPADAKMKRIAARAAAENGDFAAAAAWIRDASRLSGDTATAERAERVMQSLQGGSTGADFGPLMDLIREQTSPPARWVDDDGEGGSMTPFEQGVFVGGPAMLASVLIGFDDSRLDRVAEAVRRASRNRDVHQPSSLRLVSLSRLQERVSRMLDAGEEISDDLRHLAGLSRVEYLFVYPESGEVVIGGPAADWQADETGRVLSVSDGRPVLRLDDLVVLARTFSPDGPGFFRCSIDPQQQQVRAVEQFVSEHRRSLTKRNVAEFTRHLEQTLGLQNVLVSGIPRDSRVAQVIVEADYRMKQIGIGQVDGVPGMDSYFDLLSAKEQRRGGSVEALRWWMATGYEAVRMSPAGTAFAFTGRSVRCLSEDQIVNADGSRTATGKAEGANARFAQQFTEHFPELARQDPVFADLENIFDLALTAALIQRDEKLAHVLNAGAFREGGTWQHESVPVPDRLMTAAAFRIYSGRHLVIQVAGGVRGDMAMLARSPRRFPVDSRLDHVADIATPLGQDRSRWWWDAARP